MELGKAVVGVLFESIMSTCSDGIVVVVMLLLLSLLLLLQPVLSTAAIGPSVVALPVDTAAPAAVVAVVSDIVSPLTIFSHCSTSLLAKIRTATQNRTNRKKRANEIPNRAILES